MTEMAVAVWMDLPGIDLAKWLTVEPFWWVSRPEGEFETLSWTWHVGEPPPTPQQESTGSADPTKPAGILGIPQLNPRTSRYWWRHPTYQEACARQQRFEEEDRWEWERLMRYGSYTNLARLAPSRGYQGGLPGRFIFTRTGP